MPRRVTIDGDRYLASLIGVQLITAGLSYIKIVTGLTGHPPGESTKRYSHGLGTMWRVLEVYRYHTVDTPQSTNS